MHVSNWYLISVYWKLLFDNIFIYFTNDDIYITVYRTLYEQTKPLLISYFHICWLFLDLNQMYELICKIIEEDDTFLVGNIFEVSWPPSCNSSYTNIKYIQYISQLHVHHSYAKGHFCMTLLT